MQACASTGLQLARANGTQVYFAIKDIPAAQA